MSNIKTKEEIEILKEGGKRLAFILNELKKHIKTGISTLKLEEIARELIKGQGGTPAFLGYRPEKHCDPYPSAICVSVNDEIVHGVPNKNKILKEGDLVSVDAGLKYKNLITDSAFTVGVGKVSEENKKLLETTRKGLEAGIKAARVGNTIGDIGSAIEKVAKENGMNVYKNLVGHGVGYEVHEDPFVPNFGEKGGGEELKEGMVLALEPMFTYGRGDIIDGDDGFMYKSKDGLTNAHFEVTIAITKNGPEILTK